MRTLRVRRTATSVLLALLVVVGLVLGSTSANATAASPTATAHKSASAPAAAARMAAIKRAAASYLTTNLQGLTAHTGSSDPRYYSGGIWHDGDQICFRCEFGAGVESAAFGALTGNHAAISRVATSFSRAIRVHQHSNGGFGPPMYNEGGLDIQTTLFSSELAESYLILGSRLAKADRTAWAAALARAADFLINNGDLKWYTNGNIAIANAMVMALTYRITHLARFKSAAATALSFALAPPQVRWAGFGLHYTKKPTKADGSDGSAYLAESGGGKPGYDPSYSMMQDNVVSFWFLLTGNKTAERLANLLTNQLLKRVRTSDWTIDVSNGTRHPTADLRYGFYESAISVLALRGGRKDFVKYIQPQSKIAFKAYQDATNFANPGWSFSFGSELTPTLLAQARA